MGPQGNGTAQQSSAERSCCTESSPAGRGASVNELKLRTPPRSPARSPGPVCECRSRSLGSDGTYLRPALALARPLRAVVFWRLVRASSKPMTAA